MNERNESAGTRTTGNDPLQRSSGTAGGMPAERHDTGGTGMDRGALSGANDRQASTVGNTGKSGDTMGQAVGDKIDDMSEKLGDKIDETKSTMSDNAAKLGDKGKESL